MKKLFIILLTIAPLLTHSQESKKAIYKNAQGNWILSQETVEASYYTIQERDSLLSENDKLRKRIIQLETEKKEFIQITLAALNRSDNQISITETVTNQLNTVNNDLINIWKRLYKGIKLNAIAQTTLDNNFYFGLSLSAPIGTNWRIITTGITKINSQPNFLLGLSYSIF